MANKLDAGAIADKAKDIAVEFGGFAADAGEAVGKAAAVVKEKGVAAIDKAKEAADGLQEKVSQEQVAELLNTLYDKSLNGIPKVSVPIEQLANDYLSKSPTVERAAKALIANQILKCTTSGFLTNLGGLITLPVAIPANISSVMYVQMRMVAALAQMGGYDTRSDQVQTLVYICLTGKAASDILKSFGVKFGQKVAESAIKKNPGKVLTAINQKVGFRFITKFGEKGLINLGKLVPIVGGFVGGGFDLATTRVIADNAYKMFIENEFPVDEGNDVEIIGEEIEPTV